MKIEKIQSILKSHKVRSTAIRMDLLQFLYNQNKAVSTQEIEQHLGNNTDRITLYRTIKTFLNQGIIHRIDVDQQSFYALCSDCEVHQHDDNHIHFKCKVCETIECIEQDDAIQFVLPRDYEVKKMNIVLEGVCNSCN